MQPGSLLHSTAQQDYVSSNYSHATRHQCRRPQPGGAVGGQQRRTYPDRLSLSCNPDITRDLLPMIAKRRAAETILVVGQVHGDLPYMPGDAELGMDEFDYLLDEKDSTTLMPRRTCPWGSRIRFIGLHASTLVRDGETLQIGIGSMGDALTAALLARQADNEAYRLLLTDLDVYQWAPLISRGLYGCSEMFVNGLLVLADAELCDARSTPMWQPRHKPMPGSLTTRHNPMNVSIHGGFFLGPRAVLPALAGDDLRQAPGIQHDPHQLHQQAVRAGRARSVYSAWMRGLSTARLR